MDWKVVLFFSGHSNRKIRKYYLHVARLNREEIFFFFVTSRLHLTSVFSAVGMIHKVAQTLNSKREFLKVYVPLFSAALRPVAKPRLHVFLSHGIDEEMSFKRTRPPF